jgi:hypothetical protein
MTPPQTTPTAPPGPPTGPLSPDHLALLTHARQDSRRIRRTVTMARISAWTTGVFGGITLLGALFGDLTSLVLSIALVAVAVREGLLAKRLSLLDRLAPRALAINQLVLGAVIVAYSLWEIGTSLMGNGLSAGNQPIGDPQVDAMLKDIGRSTKVITVAVYVVVGLGGAAATAGMAAYYVRKRAIVDAFLSRTPAWVVQVIRTAA